MEEKKYTDEEIVLMLESAIATYAHEELIRKSSNRPYKEIVQWFDIPARRSCYEQILGFIHRLQAENERLTERCEIAEGTKNRRKTKMKIKLDYGAYMPTRAHEHDAGIDLYAMYTKIVPAKGSAVFDTGVHIELPKGTVGMLKSKSGLNVKHGLTSEGVIDVGYTGSICVKLYNNSNLSYRVNKGDKISQLVVMPILTPTLELVEDLEETERGNGGFGSTGK